MMTGMLRQQNSKWTVEHSYSAQNEPMMLTVAWRVIGAKRAGTSPAFAPDMVDGLVVTSELGELNEWSAYAQGGYLVLTTEHDGVLHEAPLPCPKVRAPMETRYRDGRWEKFSKREGWIKA